MFALAAFALSSSMSLSQPPAPAAPATAPAPAAAPIERQPPSNQMRQGMRPGMMQRGAQPGMRPGMRPEMMQQAHRAQMMRNHGNFHGGQMQGGFHIGPEGMWWKNPAVVQRLTLTADQTKKMDDIFQQSRIQLIDLKANLEKQQVMLEPMLSANPLDTAKASAQIDKVAQARADLEKSNAKMLLGIRAVLTPDQWTKLRTHQFGGSGGQGGPGPQGGPGAPAGGGPARGMRGGRPPSTNNLVDPVDQP
jgi:Spy/CpxP family protein refolding chaperone